MNEIIKYFTRDNITLALAILGSILSTFNFVKNLITNRKRLSVNFDRATILLCRTNHPILFRMIIENKSRLPICVSRMFLECNGKKFEFEWVPEYVHHAAEKQGKQILTHNEHLSTGFPSIAQGLGAIGGFFFLYTDKDYTGDDLVKHPVQLILNTNRGKKKIPLNLNENNFFKIKQYNYYQ